MNRDFKGIWIPKEIWLCSELTVHEKLLLVEIDSLDNDKGCYANNAYFAEFFNLSQRRVSELISSLSEKKYISVKVDKKKGNKRTVKVLWKKSSIGLRKDASIPIEQNFYHNNTSNNTILNNTQTNSNAAYNTLLAKAAEKFNILNTGLDKKTLSDLASDLAGKYYNKEIGDLDALCVTFVKNRKNVKRNSTHKRKFAENTADTW